MKKLERLTLKELENSVDLLDREESIGLKGGDNGADEYYARYGTSLPSNTGYNPATNQCYSLGDSSQNQTSYPGTDQWHSTMNVPSGNNYQPDVVGSAINHANNQPSMDPTQTINTPIGESLIRWLYDTFGSK